MCIKRLRNQYRRPRPGKGCRATGKKYRHRHAHPTEPKKLRCPFFPTRLLQQTFPVAAYECPDKQNFSFDCIHEQALRWQHSCTNKSDNVRTDVSNNSRGKVINPQYNDIMGRGQRLLSPMSATTLWKGVHGST
jgi:hypothetical protein